MSDSNTTTETTATSGTSGGTTDGKQGGDTSTTTEKTFTQAELNKLIDERLGRERAKFADYDQLKAAAGELAEIKDRDKSEVQRLTDRATTAESERDAARAEGLRFKVAVKHNISEADAQLFLTGSDEATLTQQAERLTARDAERAKAEKDAEAERRKNGNVVPNEGANTKTSASSSSEFVQGLFGGG